MKKVALILVFGGIVTESTVPDNTFKESTVTCKHCLRHFHYGIVMVWLIIWRIVRTFVFYEHVEESKNIPYTCHFQLFYCRTFTYNFK